MGKKIAIISVIVLITGLGIIGYFLQQGRKTLFTDPYIVIPLSASFVIETIDLRSFVNLLTSGNGIQGEAGKIKEFDLYNRKIKFLADHLNGSAAKKIVDGAPAVISLHLMKSGNLSPLLSMALPSDIKFKQLKEILRLSGIRSVNEKIMQGKAVLELPFEIDKKPDTAYVSVISGLLVFSSARKLMNDAINQAVGENDVRTLPGFSKIMQSSGKNEDKIYVVFRNLPRLIRPMLKKEFNAEAENIGRLAGCAGGDIYLSENGLVLSGYTESLDSNDILFKYKQGTPGTFHTYKILPSATVLFESILLNAAPEKEIRGDTPAANLARKLHEYTGDEVTRAIIDIKERKVNDNTLIIYELKNRVFAEKIFLDEFSSQINGENIFFFQPDDQIKIPVYLTPFKGFASEILPDFVDEPDDSYFAFYDNFLVTGSSYITISRLLYDNLLNKTLSNDLIYRDFASSLPSIAGYYFYCVPSQVIDYLNQFLSDDIIAALRANKESVSKIQAAGYQFASSNHMLYNSLSVRYKEEPREESTTDWETLLDTIAAVKPFFFTNHITGAREIFIQDIKNNAYLINAAGRVLWKVPLRERITGNIYMIDYFRNNKYQILFSGKNYIHLLDRNGNYVERYPVKLRSPSTNPMALFDYDNNQDYRLLIAGEDKLIYAYDKSGSSVKGWKPFRTNGIVNSEVSWFRVSGKDFLVISDETSLYFIDRTGNKRLTLKDPVTKAKGSSIRLNSGRSPYIVCTTPDGIVQQIYFDGKVNKFSLKTFSGDHSFDIFDVNGDGFGEYIFIDKGILYLYDHNRKEIFTRQFGSEELGGPINFVFSATDRKIGVFDINNKLIYLINRNGETMNGFPHKGASMFSIGKLSDKSGWHLIVGGTDRFLYNYKLDTEQN